MNIYYKNNGINKGNSNYYLNKMMKTNHTINHNNKSEIYNKKIYINASSRKNNTNMLNIMNKKKNIVDYDTEDYKKAQNAIQIFNEQDFDDEEIPEELCKWETRWKTC